MRNSIRIFENDEELAVYFASLLALRVREIRDDSDFSWVLSGGSTPKPVFEKIASHYRDSIDWDRIKVFWSDERCVGPDSADSNYRMAKENLLDHIPLPSFKIFRIRGEADPAAETVRYAEIFDRLVPSHNNFPQADLCMLGLGEDGHTASIFPTNIDLFSSCMLFETSEHPLSKQMRITATGKIINHAKLAIIIATGESKAEMVSRIINRHDGWEKLPAAHVRPVNGELLWLLDHKSATGVK